MIRDPNRETFEAGETSLALYVDVLYRFGQFSQFPEG